MFIHFITGPSQDEGGLHNNFSHCNNISTASHIIKENEVVQKIQFERNTVSLSIQGQIVEALVDTGATLSVISESLLNHLKFIKREEIRFSKSMSRNSESTMSREHGLGFLKYVFSKPMTPVQLTPVDSYIIPPKSDRRIVLKSDNVIIPKEMIKHDVQVHVPLALQFQTEFNENDRVSEIVTIVKNEDNQPLCLLPNKTLLS